MKGIPRGYAMIDIDLARRAYTHWRIMHAPPTAKQWTELKPKERQKYQIMACFVRKEEQEAK